MKVISFVLLVGSLLISLQVQARNEIKEYSIAEAMALEQFKSKLGNEVRFYFGDAMPSGVSKTIGEWPSLKKPMRLTKRTNLLVNGLCCRRCLP